MRRALPVPGIVPLTQTTLPRLTVTESALSGFAAQNFLEFLCAAIGMTHTHILRIFYFYARVRLVRIVSGVY